MKLTHDQVNGYLDFYEKLLTEKQQKIMNLYYREDFSLSEIAEQMNITRSAVQDTIKRSSNILKHYEEILLLVHKYRIRMKYYEILAQSQDVMIQQISKDLKESENENYE